MTATASSNAVASGLPTGLAEVRDYYTSKVARHGPTPLGVDWACARTQELRFAQLLRLCDFSAPFTLNDLGCGYGALLAVLGRCHRGKQVNYLGMDLSELMIRHARRRWRRRRDTALVVADRCQRLADYSLASGIFNVKLDQPLAMWERLVATTLDDLHRHSRRGFAVNFLSPAPDGSPNIPQLYRPPAEQWLRYCEQELGCSVIVLGEYGLHEYTLLARPGQGFTSRIELPNAPAPRAGRERAHPSDRSGTALR